MQRNVAYAEYGRQRYRYVAGDVTFKAVLLGNDFYSHCYSFL